MAITSHGQIAFAAGADKATGQIVPALCPLLVKAIGNASIAIAGGLTGALNLNAQLSITPPTLALTLQALIDFQASCSFAIGLGMPSVSFDVTAALQLVADLQLALSLLGTLDTLLHVPVFVPWLGYPFPLFGTGLGGAVGAFGGPLEHALILAAVDPGFVLPPPLHIAKTKLEEFATGASYPGVGVFTSLCDLTPVTCGALPQGRAGIQFQLDAALKLAAHIKLNPPTLSASFDASAKFAAHLKAAAKLALPKVKFALDASASLAFHLQARFSAMIQLGLALNRPDATLFVYTWTDTGGPGLGAELTTELLTTWNDGFTSTSQPCEALVLGTLPLDPVSWPALTSSLGLFGGAA